MYTNWKLGEKAQSRRLLLVYMSYFDSIGSLPFAHSKGIFKTREVLVEDLSIKPLPSLSDRRRVRSILARTYCFFLACDAKFLPRSERASMS